MTHLSQQIAPLKSWDEFEDLCCALFQKEWLNPLAQKNGRRGQEQNGVDVFGQNRNSNFLRIVGKIDNIPRRN